MLYQKEIHEINQLTKRFHRDCRRIFAQIRQDIEETTLTKDEIKALVAAFEPHIDTWESRANCTLHKFDDFLGGLEAPDEKIDPESETESDCEINP